MGNDRFSYDEMPYTSWAVEASHPDRLATLAVLFGLDPPEVPGSRVLELGCAAGGNLIPLAVAFPEGRFVGVDLSERQVGEGRERIAALGLRNVELHHLDLRALDASFGAFDYIVCHGVWSWVAADARARILEICRKNLAPDGLAYVSYNVLPGWYLRGMVRGMMLYHSDGFAEPGKKVAQSRALLEFLLEGAPEGADWRPWLEADAASVRGSPDHYLFHDHLSEVNHPVWFHQFAAAVAEHGLRYLGEAVFHTMRPIGLSEKARRTVEGIPHLVRAQQYLDFLTNRSFRSSVLVQGEARVDGGIDVRRVERLHVACHGKPPPDLVVHDDSAAAFATHGGELKMNEPLVKAAFAELCEAWPRTMPFPTLLARARDRAASAESEEADRGVLARRVLEAHGNGAVELRTTAAAAVSRSERPRVWSMARFEAAHGSERLTNLRHQTVECDPLLRRVASLCDGTRDEAGLLEALREDIAGGTLTPRIPEGGTVDLPAELSERLRLLEQLSVLDA